MKNNFFIQFLQRIAKQSPKFFSIIKWVAGALAVIAGATAFLVSNGIWVPDFADTLDKITTALWPIFTAIFGMSFLPVKDEDSISKPSKSNRKIL